MATSTGHSGTSQNVISTEGGEAAAVEISLYFAFVPAFAHLFVIP
jgi:hypothetical protein